MPEEVVVPHVGQLALAGLALALAAGCSGSSHATGVSASASSGAAASSAGHNCGTSYTAAHVPVIVQAPTGIACSVALRVEADYTKKLENGEAPGNGGGGPVPVDGWTCEGYPTPQVLSTGRASECHKDSTRFFAILPTPTMSVTP
jgi:hypothetical protein